MKCVWCGDDDQSHFQHSPTHCHRCHAALSTGAVSGPMNKQKMEYWGHGMRIVSGEATTLIPNVAQTQMTHSELARYALRILLALGASDPGSGVFPKDVEIPALHRYIPPVGEPPIAWTRMSLDGDFKCNDCGELLYVDQDLNRPDCKCGQRYRVGVTVTDQRA